MLPKWHILGGAFFSLALYFTFGLGWLATLVIFISSFMIDIDHYFLYILKEKKIHPIRAVRWNVERRSRGRGLQRAERILYKEEHYFLHCIEALILLGILSIFFRPIVLVLIGFGFHFILDLAEKISLSHHPAQKLSHIWLWYRNRERKKVFN
jgi:hypothetical protein